MTAIRKPQLLKTCPLGKQQDSIMADATPGMFQIYHGGRLTEGDDKGQNPNDLKFMAPSQGVSSGASQKE